MTTHHLEFSTARIRSVLAVFALGYMLSSLLRVLPAALAPLVSSEFSLSPTELGLWASGFTLSLGLMQPAVAYGIDRYGPRKVLLGLIAIAIVGGGIVSGAHSIGVLTIGRFLMGLGMSASLMAPIHCFRVCFPAKQSMRMSVWVMMAGMAGMLLATYPLYYTMAQVGRPDHSYLLSVTFVFLWMCVYLLVPSQISQTNRTTLKERFVPVLKNRYFWRLAPLAFVNYGIVMAILCLWAGPWLTDVAHYSPQDTAFSLMIMSVIMMSALILFNRLIPKLEALEIYTDHLMAYGIPLSISALVGMAMLGDMAGTFSVAAFSILSSFLIISQPALSMNSESDNNGMLYYAFNCLMFVGTSVWQLLIGVSIDTFKDMGCSLQDAYQFTFGILAALSIIAFFAYVLLTPTKKISHTHT